MTRAESAAETARWLATQACSCGARQFGATPVLLETEAGLRLRFTGCATCHQPTHVELRLPDAQEAAVRGALANAPAGPTRVIDPDVVLALAPYVAAGFPDYGTGGGRAIDPSGAPLGDDWRLVEWLRGSLGFGQARCVRRDGTRAIATFTRTQSDALARVADKLRLPSPGIAPMLDVRQAGSYAVLFEAEPQGVPLATPMFGMAPELAMTLAGRLLEIVADAASRNGVLRGLRPELVFLDHDLAIRVAPRAELFAGGMAQSRDVEPEYPFDALYQGPELVQGARPSSASDVFSCCAILVYALTRRTPFPGDGPMYQVMAMLQGPPPLPPGLDGRIAELVRRGLDPDPAKRPTARELANALLAA